MINFIFDVDGTLTLPRQPMTEEFSRFFQNWIVGKNVHLISGSDIDKIKEQVPDIILMGVNSVHACSGNQIWESSYHHLESKYTELKCVKETQWIPTHHLMWEIIHLLDRSPYPLQLGNHIENRVGSINISTIGRNANIEQRDEYEKWDKDYGERIDIVSRLCLKFPDIDCAIGGQISIDIYPKGKDKSQILNWISSRDNFLSFIDEPVIFFGDKCLSGNDKTLAKSIVKNGFGSFHNVKDHTETLTILKEFYV